MFPLRIDGRMRTATGIVTRDCSDHPQTRRSSQMAKLDSIEDCPPLPEVEGVEFRHVPGYLGYAAGDDGSIWSCVPYRGSRCWRHLSPTIHKRSGYHRLAVSIPLRWRKQVTVATLVCTAFHGPRPAGMECCHGDGTRSNDAAANLRWGTRRENMQDKIKHGRSRKMTHACGENHHTSKFSDRDVDIIRKLAPYLSRAEIARLYGVRGECISKIILRQRRVM